MKSQIHIQFFVTEHLKLCISCEKHFFSCASSFVHLVKIPGVLKKAEAPAGLCSQQGEAPFGGLEVNTLPPQLPIPHTCHAESTSQSVHADKQPDLAS